MRLQIRHLFDLEFSEYFIHSFTCKIIVADKVFF